MSVAPSSVLTLSMPLFALWGGYWSCHMCISHVIREASEREGIWGVEWGIEGREEKRIGRKKERERERERESESHSRYRLDLALNEERETKGREREGERQREDRLTE